MNINEIIKRLRYKAENIKAKLEPEYFSECADYLEKYRWHYLWKNPDDIPPEPVFGSIGYIVKQNNIIEPFTMYWNGKRFTDEYDELPDDEIIAWREIEPYEED